MAAQIAIRMLTENPYATAQELPIKFLVLINSAVPPCIMPLDGQEITNIPIEEAPILQMLFDIFKANPADYTDKARPAKLANGRKVRKRGPPCVVNKPTNNKNAHSTGLGKRHTLHDFF